MAERASIFGDDDLDISDFKPTPAKRPTPPVDKAAIREVAEKRGFQSREPIRERGRGEEAKTVPPRQQRRHTTGRNKQLNIKATEAAITRFYAIADGQGWVLGETFERAIDALERQVRAEA